MRCPRCLHVASQQRVRCPRCGHLLSRDGKLDPAADVALSRSEDEALGLLKDFSTEDALARPLRDYAPGIAERPVAVQPGPAGRASRPLFPLGARAAASRPLSVRRQTPEVPKFRIPTARAAAREVSLQFEAPGFDADTDVTAPQPPAVDAPVRQLRRRLLAGLLDTMLLLGVDAAVVYFTMRLVGLPFAAVAQLPIVPLLTFLLLFDAGYAVAMTALGGQTIGKMAVGLRVEQTDGSPVTTVRALIRTGACVISVLPLGLGFAGILSRSGRALHDCLADTRVVTLS